METSGDRFLSVIPGAAGIQWGPFWGLASLLRL
jgi:hypothetical protein